MSLSTSTRNTKCSHGPYQKVQKTQGFCYDKVEDRAEALAEDGLPRAGREVGAGRRFAHERDKLQRRADVNDAFLIFFQYEWKDLHHGMI